MNVYYSFCLAFRFLKFNTVVRKESFISPVYSSTSMGTAESESYLMHTSAYSLKSINLYALWAKCLQKSCWVTMREDQSFKMKERCECRRCLTTNLPSSFSEELIFCKHIALNQPLHLNAIAGKLRKLQSLYSLTSYWAKNGHWIKV